MFTAEERERVRERVLELARADERITGGALTGSVTFGGEDDWSDIDTAFGIREDADADSILGDWTATLDRELQFVHHFDLRRGATVYRVFLLPSTLELDISLTPASQFRSYGPNFKLVFGEIASAEPAATPDANELIGWGWIYAFSARAAIARGKLWQAASFVEGVRNHGLMLASLRHDLPTAHARGVHRLDAAVTEPWNDSLVRSLAPEELRRALAVAWDALLREVAAVDPALADDLRDLLP